MSAPRTALSIQPKTPVPPAGFTSAPSPLPALSASFFKSEVGLLLSCFCAAGDEEGEGFSTASSSSEIFDKAANRQSAQFAPKKLPLQPEEAFTFTTMTVYWDFVTEYQNERENQLKKCA